LFVLAVTKGNLAPREWRSTLAYRLRGQDFQFDDGTAGSVATAEWIGVVDISADEATAPPERDGDRSALEETKEWLADFLAAGPIGARAVREKGDSAGHAWATIRRAKGALKVVSKKCGVPGESQEWKWCLPEDAQETAKAPRDEPLSTLSTFDQEEIF
jgi:hypothetical protein